MGGDGSWVTGEGNGRIDRQPLAVSKRVTQTSLEGGRPMQEEAPLLVRLRDELSTKQLGVNGDNQHASTAGDSFSNSPFQALSGDHLPAGPENVPSPNAGSSRGQRKHRGRVDIVRQTAHRGGKTVTVVTNFVGIGLAEKQQLAKAMQKACGTGGTVKDGRIEIQGDRRTEVARILTEAGFRPVFAGG